MCFVDPDDPNIVFNVSNGSPMGGGAAFTRNNLKTGQNEVRNIWPEPIFGRMRPTCRTDFSGIPRS